MSFFICVHSSAHSSCTDYVKIVSVDKAAACLKHSTGVMCTSHLFRQAWKKGQQVLLGMSDREWVSGLSSAARGQWNRTSGGSAPLPLFCNRGNSVFHTFLSVNSVISLRNVNSRIRCSSYFCFQRIFLVYWISFYVFSVLQEITIHDRLSIRQNRMIYLWPILCRQFDCRAVSFEIYVHCRS